MSGRELSQRTKTATRGLEDLARTVRTKYPLRERLKAKRQSEESLRQALTVAIDQGDVPALRQALDSADEGRAARFRSR